MVTQSRDKKLFDITTLLKSEAGLLLHQKNRWRNGLWVVDLQNFEDDG